MKLLKNKNFLISTAFCIAFAAVIYPYDHDMYIPGAFTVICAFLNLCSSVLFASLLYRKLEGTFPAEEIWGYVWYLLLQAAGHGIYAIMNWGSWVCLALTAAAFLALWRSWRSVHPPKWKLGRKGKGALALLAVVLLMTAGILRQPWNRARLFVALHGETLSQRNLAAAEGYPGAPRGLHIDSCVYWPGEHTMVEYWFNGKGYVHNSTYYGCYYSYDDVPLAFQNISVPLVSDGEDQWIWRAEGDNHGMTRKIQDHWYYFEASF